eukprot:TRINITY_DN4941_c0_g1_i1.p1 TRINITY_DN4941_c0_g1~~TRINITY_DN4941_c0_g1_i1.p1  ORF type:complete len:604 (+),score=140.88 TRINITY_DN4941_c0_g1_i1:65-1876(+)
MCIRDRGRHIGSDSNTFRIMTRSCMMHFAGVLLLVLSATVVAETTYKDQQLIRVYVGKVQPFDNPSETYSFYSLPFCAPKEVHEESETLGEVLSGNRKMNSLYKAFYKRNETNKKLCETKLKADQKQMFRTAIEEDYIMELFVEDFPVFDYIGMVHDSKILIRTHLIFRIGYNSANQIVYVTLESGKTETNYTELLPDDEPQVLRFTYDVEFIDDEEDPITVVTDIEDRKRADPSEPMIHWIAIINSFVLVVLLLGFVSVVIARVVRSDVNAINDPESGEKGDNVGWKMIRIEVFQIPLQRSLLCAAVGSGSQLLLLCFLLIFLGCIGMYYGNQGALNTAGILLYAFTASVAGYTSARLYKYLGGKHWAFNLLLVSLIFPVPAFAIWFVLNNMAWAAGSTAALPITTILFIILLWALVTFPLTIIGGITGRLKSDSSIFEESRIPKIQKPIPDRPWYKSPLFCFLVAGFIPFVAIYLELKFVYLSVWGHKIYTLYGVLFVAIFLLLNVVACVSLSITYFQLSAQDYRWWWRSFFYGGASSIFIYAYSAYFYFHNSHMFGFLQGSFYFGYMFIAALALFLMFGAIGFLTSLRFIKYIYSQSKVD